LAATQRNATMTITYNSTNYFLLTCQHGFILIDAGWHGKLQRFKQELASFNIGLNQIKYIFITHHHHDHSALVQDLRVLTNAKLIVHKQQVDFITEGVTDYKKIKQYNWLLWLIDRVFRPFIKYNYKPVKIEQSDFIINSDVDDTVLRAIGVNGKILATPGHSIDSVSILLDNGVAYIGDLAMNIMGFICKTPLPIEAENYQQVNESLKKLIDLGAKEFYPSHGGPIDKKTVENILK
jgi:glyoxylase-like metal-dependent hydrolase (beta-lactamase superfamily II)